MIIPPVVQPVGILVGVGFSARALMLYQVRRASFDSRWTSASILPALPLPGTPDLRTLLSLLEPFSPDPKSITVSTPTNRLLDVLLAMDLFAGEVKIGIRHDGFSISIPELVDAQLGNASRVAATLFDSMRQLLVHARPGKYEVQYGAHILVEGTNAAEFLRSWFAAHEGMRLEGITCRVRLPGSGDVDARFVVERSVITPGGLFIDFLARYPEEDDLGELTGRAVLDVLHVLEKFGLKNPAAGA